MENYKMMQKFKIIVCCLIVAFVAAMVMAVVSFVQIGEARRANIEFERQLEQIIKEKNQLQKDYEALQSGEKLDEEARDNGMIADNENDIILG